MYAALQACDEKSAASLAILLRWGTRVYQQGLDSETGVTWLDVACRETQSFMSYGSMTEHLPVPKALYSSKRGARPREVLGKLFELVPAGELARVKHLDPRRGDQLVRWRRAHEAHRDASMVFQAAREGRPMELEKRLRLGKLAGGAWVTGVVDGVGMDVLEAARAGGHVDCVEVLINVRKKPI